MNRIITVIIAAALSAGMLQAQETSFDIKVGEVTMTVDASKGGKILSYRYGETEVLSQMKFPNWFGSTFWTSPQKEWNWPPVPEIDSKPYTATRENGKIVMTSQLSQRIPLRIVKEFSTDEADNAIVITYSIINESDAERYVAPWEITRVPADGLIFFAAPVEGIWPAGLMPFTSKSGIAWYAVDQADENRKVNADGKGWLAYAGNGLLMVKKFVDIAPTAPAPDEAEIQVYVNRGKTYIELESQGAYTRLQPGEKVSWTVRWYLVPQNLPLEPSAKLARLVRKTAKVK